MPFPSSNREILIEVGRDAMACRFDLLLHPNRPENGVELAYQALDTISYLEQLWSVYLQTSELTTLNLRGDSVEVSLSSSTVQLLQHGIDIWKETKGAFDITANKLTKLWGFFRRQGCMPKKSEIEQALETIGSQNIELDIENRTARLRGGIEINPGGIGKGFAIDLASAHFPDGDLTHYAFHGGKSSIRCEGNQDPMVEDGKLGGWRIAVRHPEQSEHILGTLKLCNQSLGTSGPANQFFYFKGKRFGHIIDPRTGWPADTMLSMTILHPSTCYADALATGLYVLGIDYAIEYCQSHPDTAMLAILPGTRQGQVEVVTANLLDGQWATA